MKQKQTIILYTFLLSLLFIFTSINYAHATESQIINAHVGHYPTSTISVTFEDVEINGNYAFVSDYNLPGLRVINLTDPSNPSLSALEPVTKSGTYEIEIANNIAYLRAVESSDYDIEYIDISDPVNPVYKGLVDLNHARGFDAFETILFVTNYTEIISFNFTDIDTPVELDRLDLGGSAQFLTYIDNYTYTCTSDNQLMIVNATDSSDLVLVSSTSLGDFFAQSFLINGTTLYASGYDSTKTVNPERVHRGYVKAIDISNKSDPTPFSEIYIDGINGVGLALLENKLFVGACAEGIKIVDITTPSSLKSLGYYDDYQDMYCDGGADYALYPKLYVDGTYGNLLVFVSMGCGLNIIRADGFEFEFNIPGFEIYFVILSAMMGLTFIYLKLRKKIKSIKSI
ncbi:MAG: LVIVD repeat-containing protein [Promethearchaeota archaeon]